MKYSEGTLRLLGRLAAGEQVTAGEVSSVTQKAIFQSIMDRGGIVFRRTGRSRGIYSAPSPDHFRDICASLDPVLSNIDAALKLAKGEDMNRSERVGAFGASKAGGIDRTMRGFTILADRDVDVCYFGRLYMISRMAGLHVIERRQFHVEEKATIVVVENAECFYDLRWMDVIGLNRSEGPYLIMNRFPVSEEGKRWLEDIPNRVLYFGDFDLAGIRIYETEFKRRLGKRVSFLVPSDISERIRLNGNPALYTEQINKGFSGTVSYSGELDGLLKMIHTAQSCYEQEGYLNSLKNG